MSLSNRPNSYCLQWIFLNHTGLFSGASRMRARQGICVLRQGILSHFRPLLGIFGEMAFSKTLFFLRAGDVPPLPSRCATGFTFTDYFLSQSKSPLLNAGIDTLICNKVTNKQSIRKYCWPHPSVAHLLLWLSSSPFQRFYQIMITIYNLSENKGNKVNIYILC